ncbi:SAS053 family protein [Staphylococcus gallinarum]|uniref:SAS053 family DNA gyrase inhibitor n=1 Tax=Staphylococcus gallinarum TaxID=1293 RepID=UPI000D1C6D42|nr:SAS053 family protein [Staphylococcus gallinarum]MBU7218432.1 hypothetical protein [Staphylococcus gallinarum]MCD8786823.1 hypothetical protein [Staphylococcus gallinarum]MCD8794711.1 hypothetical protein [Staphylococcus gallinarum]MCD8842630.1 hypothetical protein [Staphylococcus gallinarum]MCD8859680.1 hypothetical protein [Staphylococcus gallinarum]
MTDKNKFSKNLEHQADNEMVDDYEDVVELGKEMEQISEQNDEEKLNQSHDSKVRSDLSDDAH